MALRSARPQRRQWAATGLVARVVVVIASSLRPCPGLMARRGTTASPSQLLDVCDLQDAWSRRRHLLAWGAKSRTASTATAALAEHLRHAALSEPASRGRHPDPGQ
ncbi:hypothetical protein [Streptomyces sp. NBRC 110028]|uniref:hypothetical protein n=1 Tax=Streptomyces sp. NBRC 110028 TaxID=1621260 RepID=UPI001F350AB8|nr:hypothetical protein [Streptomyces sp. NBRC 110028]